MNHTVCRQNIASLCLGFAACGDDNDGLDPNAAAPVINFPMEQLDVDLNKVDNLPLVAVIKSQAAKPKQSPNINKVYILRIIISSLFN